MRFYPKGSSFKRALAASDGRTKVVAGQVAGDFTLPADPREKLAFIAGGIGITPYRSMLKYLLDTRARRDIVLLYATRAPQEFIYGDVLAEAQAKLGMRAVYTVTDLATIPPNWTGARGRIDERMIAAAIPDYRERVFYLWVRQAWWRSTSACCGAWGWRARTSSATSFPASCSRSHVIPFSLLRWRIVLWRGAGEREPSPAVQAPLHLERVIRLCIERLSLPAMNGRGAARRRERRTREVTFGIWCEPVRIGRSDGQREGSTRMQPQVESATVTGIDHVQVAMPAGGASRARAFYGGVLGLREIAKPEALAGRGGVWFQCGQQQAHLGVDPRFVPQHKGHPALLVADIGRVRARLAAAGAPVIEDELLPGYERIYTLRSLRQPPRTAAPRACDAGFSVDQRRIRRIQCRGETSLARPARAGIRSRRRRHQSACARELRARSRSLRRQPWSRARVGLAGAAGLGRAAASRPCVNVSTGGGHTALALAPHVARVTASDLTPRMLAAARRFLSSQGVTNAEFVIADASASLSWMPRSSRDRPHRAAPLRRRAAGRPRDGPVVPGGRLALIDNIAPEEPDSWTSI